MINQLKNAASSKKQHTTWSVVFYFYLISQPAAHARSFEYHVNHFFVGLKKNAIFPSVFHFRDMRLIYVLYTLII